MTLSTVQSMPVLHIAKSGFVTKTGFHAAWPNCDKYMAMELRTWGAVSFMPTVMKVCVACSLLGMFQAASADLLSPSLDSQSQRYLNVCDISTFKFRTRLFLCGQTRWEKKRIQTAELRLSLTIDETGLRTFDHRRHEMLRRRADAHQAQVICLDSDLEWFIGFACFTGCMHASHTTAPCPDHRGMRRSAICWPSAWINVVHADLAWSIEIWSDS